MNKPDRVDALVDKLLAEQETYQGGAKDDLARLWRNYLQPYRLHILATVFLTLLHAVLPYGWAFTGRYLFDHVLPDGNGGLQMPASEQTMNGLWLVVGCNGLIWVFSLLCMYVRSWLVIGAGQQMVYVLREQLHEKLQALHIGFYEHTPTGRIMSRVLDDVNVIRQWTASHVVNLLSSLVRLLMGMGVALYLNAYLGAVILLALPVYAWAFYVLRPRIRRVSIALRRLNASMYARAAERIDGVRVVKAFGREQHETASFGRMMLNHVRVALRQVRYAQGLGVLAGVVTAVTSALVLYIAVSQVQRGALSLGAVIAFITVLNMIFEPVNTLTSLATALQGAFVVLRRVFALLDEQEDVVPGRIVLQGMTGKITFEHVAFTYPGQKEPALHDVCLRIQPGERIAVMGPSGAGKSTLFQLLMRFYDPQDGTVRVGGVNLVDADSGSVRRHVCMVQQEPVIFSGTIADNIVYGRLDATPSMVMNAARQAELHDFIMALPVKYETEVGENGVTLSGGQKQRLALATALLTDPEILLLDDTTSALDATTEARIRETLSRALEGRTSLTITQRIATAQACDRIVVLEKGRISQIGSHAELIAQDGFYRRICLQQMSL